MNAWKKMLRIAVALALPVVFALGCTSMDSRYGKQNLLFGQSCKYHDRTCSCHYCLIDAGTRFDAGRPLARMSSFRRR